MSEWDFDQAMAELELRRDIDEMEVARGNAVYTPEGGIIYWPAGDWPAR